MVCAAEELLRLQAILQAILQAMGARVAGAALSKFKVRFAWQEQRFRSWKHISRGRRSTFATALGKSASSRQWSFALGTSRREMQTNRFPLIINTAPPLPP